jgi:hypothetical protein
VVEVAMLLSVASERQLKVPKVGVLQKLLLSKPDWCLAQNPQVLTLLIPQGQNREYIEGLACRQWVEEQALVAQESKEIGLEA